MSSFGICNSVDLSQKRTNAELGKVQRKATEMIKAKTMYQLPTSKRKVPAGVGMNGPCGEAVGQGKYEKYWPVEALLLPR